MMARPTKAQVAAREEQARIRARYEAQEAKRATRLQVDQNGVLWAVLTLVGLTFLATAVWVANQTFAVAQFARLPHEAMGWLAFAGIEIAVLWSLAYYLILRSRGEKAMAWFAVMLTYSGITIATSVFHTLESWGFEWLEPRMWAGVALAAAVPLSFVLSVKGLSRVIFAQQLRKEDLG